MIAREIDRHEHIPLALYACRNKNYDKSDLPRSPYRINA